LYEDLSTNPEHECGKLFSILGLPREHLLEALKAMELDSQQGVLCLRGSGDIGVSTLVKMESALKELESPVSISMGVEEFKKVMLLKIDAA
jgi:hypothetical protein